MTTPDDLHRYSRQTILPEIGTDGQQKLLDASVLLVGCGALGSVLAELLVRAGVGHLRIADRDFIEPNNLQRQLLFDEDDIAADLPKAEAAARKLRRINSAVSIEAAVTDVTHENISSLARGVSAVADGTDNFETRYLINDLAISEGLPWVYGAVIGTTGLVMPIAPKRTACLRCMFEDPPPAESNPTCETAGVLGSAVLVVASLQATELIKLLTGQYDALSAGLTSIDLWEPRMSTMDTQAMAGRADCPCCGRRNFEYLRGDRGSSAATLCGRNAVQISLAQGEGGIDLEVLEKKLFAAPGVFVRCNEFLLRAESEQYELTVFPDGRAIVKGTDDPARARAFCSRFLGS